MSWVPAKHERLKLPPDAWCIDCAAYFWSALQVEWFNKSGDLVGKDGTVVNAVHPYQRDMIQFVERENDYVMPAAKAKTKAAPAKKKK